MTVRSYAENYKGYDYLFHTKSVEHEAKPVDKKYVRGDIIKSAQVLKVLEDGSTEVNLIVHSDPKVVFGLIL